MMMSKSFAKSNRRNRYAAPIGGVFILLCLVGFVSVIMLCFNLTKNVLDNSGKKHEYEAMLLPVVMFDPPPFEGAENFDELSLLQSSIWATLLGEGRGKYQEDDNLMLIVPASDVDVTAHNLFGPNAAITHNTFGDYEITYLYDSKTKSYHVPVDAMTPAYTPRVEEIEKKGDNLLLRVGYIPPSSVLDIAFTEKGLSSDPEPVKYMIYELHKGKNGYYIFAIRDVEGATFITGSDAMLPENMGQGSSMEGVLPEALPPAEGSSSDSESLPEDGSSDENQSDSEVPEESSSAPEIQG